MIKLQMNRIIVINLILLFISCKNDTNSLETVKGNYCSKDKTSKLILKQDKTYSLKQAAFGETLIDYGSWTIENNSIRLINSIDLINYFKMDTKNGTNDTLVINIDNSILKNSKFKNMVLKIGDIKYDINKNIVLNKKDINEDINITNNKYSFSFYYYTDYDTINITLEKELYDYEVTESLVLEINENKLIHNNNVIIGKSVFEKCESQ
jgi:hypothetical protein